MISITGKTEGKVLTASMIKIEVDEYPDVLWQKLDIQATCQNPDEPINYIHLMGFRPVGGKVDITSPLHLHFFCHGCYPEGKLDPNEFFLDNYDIDLQTEDRSFRARKTENNTEESKYITLSGFGSSVQEMSIDTSVGDQFLTIVSVSLF